MMRFIIERLTEFSPQIEFFPILLQLRIPKLVPHPSFEFTAKTEQVNHRPGAG